MAMFVPETAQPLSPDSRYRISVAGAESNVAISLAKLGLSAAWVSRVGDDAFGRLILEQIATMGVDVTHVTTDGTRPTGVAFKNRATRQTVVDYYRTGSAASGMDASTALAVHSFSPRLVHLTGITAALSESCEAFIERVIASRRPGTMISFDVNWRPALWAGRETDALLTIAQHADIVLVGLDEATDLWGVASVDGIRALIDAPTLVVKRGAAGSTVFHEGERTEVPALQLDVLEPVGAGDAFAAGFLAGMLRGLTMLQAARLGTIVASSSLSVLTDIGHLPEPDYIQELLHADEEEWLAHRYDLTRA